MKERLLALVLLLVSTHSPADSWYLLERVVAPFNSQLFDSSQDVEIDVVGTLNIDGNEVGITVSACLDTDCFTVVDSLVSQDCNSDRTYCRLESLIDGYDFFVSIIGWDSVNKTIVMESREGKLGILSFGDL